MTATVFRCAFCKTIKPISREGGSGYAITPGGRKICYACAGEWELRRMERTGRATLYVTKIHDPRCSDPGHRCCAGYKITNWPGTLSHIATDWRTGRHNIAGSRLDVWFVDRHGARWHGVNFGDSSQILHCRRLAD